MEKNVEETQTISENNIRKRKRFGLDAFGFSMQRAQQALANRSNGMDFSLAWLAVVAVFFFIVRIQTSIYICMVCSVIVEPNQVYADFAASIHYFLDIT